LRETENQIHASPQRERIYLLIAVIILALLRVLEWLLE